MTRRLGPVGLAAVGLLAAACSSGGHARVGAGDAAGSRAPATAATISEPTSPPSTVAGQLPTVFDCGGGAYKPATLLVVCGVASTNVTDVQWSTWTVSGASGHGEVHLPGHPAAPADLALGKVVQTGSGPQFSQLTATWTGTSPDGHPMDVFQLATAPAQG